VVVNDGNDFFTLLMFVIRVANAVAAFFGYRVGAITMQNAEIELVVRR
jgi:hypothetical protein